MDEEICLISLTWNLRFAVSFVTWSRAAPIANKGNLIDADRGVPGWKEVQIVFIEIRTAQQSRAEENREEWPASGAVGERNRCRPGGTRRNGRTIHRCIAVSKTHVLSTTGRGHTPVRKTAKSPKATTSELGASESAS
jgi:hypothetical protein